MGLLAKNANHWVHSGFLNRNQEPGSAAGQGLCIQKLASTEKGFIFPFPSPKSSLSPYNPVSQNEKVCWCSLDSQNGNSVQANTRKDWKVRRHQLNLAFLQCSFSPRLSAHLVNRQESGSSIFLVLLPQRLRGLV